VTLGIVDGISDAGAALFVEGKLVAAVNEERLTGRKLQGGFPALAIAECLRLAGVAAADVEQVVVAGCNTPTLLTRLCRPLQRAMADTAGIVFDRPWSPAQRCADLLRYRLRLTTNRPGSWTGRLETRLAESVLRRALPQGLRRAKVSLVDHHTAHAASAFHSAPFERALVLTADSHGDGVSVSVSRGEGAVLTRLWSAGPFTSFGTFFALVTKQLGFQPYRHEGKVVALAAHGDPERVPVRFPLRLCGDAGMPRLEYDGAWGLEAWRWMRPLKQCQPADVAAWLQRGTEAGLSAIAAHFAAATGLRELCVAGGVFANVRVNLRLCETPGIERLFVFPHMGDGGLAVGAVLAAQAPAGFTLPPLFLGPDVAERECEQALRAAGLPFERPPSAEERLAELLARGKVVARCAGRMEYGPRALGNRSVLSEATDPDVRSELNRRLDRTEFMPFAPVTLGGRADERYDGLGRAPDCARHMTAAFRVRPALVAEAPGAVHVDGTARCQVTSEAETPDLHRLLAAYERRTGRASLINTSFNRHESPIVCTADDAVRTFRHGGLDAMQLGPFLALADARP
jgi:carbamoyltransferase